MTQYAAAYFLAGNVWINCLQYHPSASQPINNNLTAVSFLVYPAATEPGNTAHTGYYAQST